MDKIKVGILGATGTVGQRLVQLLSEHPWFQITALAASDASAGKTYGAAYPDSVGACHWKLEVAMPEAIKDMVVQDTRPGLDCQVVFSALSADVAGDIEAEFARAGYVVVSNARNHRMDKNVPLLIPEVNPEHLGLIEQQKSRWGNSSGFIVTNPNCSATPLAMVLAPLHRIWGVEEVFVTTLQAISGAGYPGLPSLDILDNVIPFIEGEEEKIETETKKILGDYQDGSIIPATIRISAQVNRVAVVDGHLESVAVKLKQQALISEIEQALTEFVALPQKLNLPSAPERPIVVKKEKDRPQPRLDRNTEGGMAAVVGRVRSCPVFDVKFSLLGHNTIRGAAGAAVLNAELLKAKGYLTY
ncbi:MAG: aspartate-semialdehyde dehydrogenase [candidate division KSB1 bacterium]|nr:aspartate-semialdehyde dehydrogenase [candidate division KSB1 bacterium]